MVGVGRTATVGRGAGAVAAGFVAGGAVGGAADRAGLLVHAESRARPSALAMTERLKLCERACRPGKSLIYTV